MSNLLISIQAGNTDNKLTQHEWAKFVRRMSEVLGCYELARHFFGGPETYAPWQNVCWVCEIAPSRLDELKLALTDVRQFYQQDAICLITGQAEML